MKIDKDTAVTVRLKITDNRGTVLNDGREPVAYLHGGYDNLFPKLEALLDGQEAGFKASIDLPPEDAFGVRDEALVQTIPKSQFPPGVKVGGELERIGEDGQPQVFNVVKVKGDKVLLDGNHPYADKTLHIVVTVVSVRAASAEEVAHGHVHGAHGHHH